MKRIIIEWVLPPIPLRSADWRAWEDGTEETGPYGWGESATEALANLMEQLAENSDDPR